MLKTLKNFNFHLKFFFEIISWMKEYSKKKNTLMKSMNKIKISK